LPHKLPLIFSLNNSLELIMRIVQIEKQRGWSGQVQQAFFTAKGLHLRGHKVLMVCQPNRQKCRRDRHRGHVSAHDKMAAFHFCA